MATTEELNDAIADNAAGPKSVTADGISVQQHEIDAQIKARNDRASQAASSTAKRGLIFTKLVPGGCG